MRKRYKYTLGVATTLAISIAPIATISCNMSVGFKPAIFNYEDYIYQEGEEKINEKFNYKTFGDLPELEQSIKQGRAAAGIGSDYYNAKLAKQGAIKKIDFYRALKIDKKITDIETKLKSIYTKEVWDQLSLFDSYLGDVDEDGKTDHLWEYMIPYFMQYKVLAFNIKRGKWSDAEKNILSPSSGTTQEKQNGIEGLFKDHSYLGMLKTLKEHGYNNFVNNDYSRDNLMIGSEYTSEFTGKVTNENYKKFTNNYIKTIEEGLGLSFKGSDVISESSGVDSLDHLVNPDQTWGASFLYNGDAQFAHLGGSNEYEEGANIRFVSPDNPVYLLDGMVVSSKMTTNSSMENDLYDVFYASVFKGANENNVTDETPAYNNYDYVGYTTPFKSIYKYVDAEGAGDYFEDDWVGKSLLAINGNIAKNKVIWPIDDSLQNKYSIYYEQETKG